MLAATQLVGFGASSSGGDVSVAGTPAGTDFNTATGAGATLNLPSGVVAGELLLIFAAADNGGIFGSGNVPTGFTKLDLFLTASSGGDCGIYYKVATGSEGATIAFPNATAGTAASAIALRVQNWKSSQNPEDVNSSTADPPALTPSWGAANNLWFAFLGLRRASSPTVTYPANYTVNNVTTANGHVYVGWRNNSATSEDPATFTVTGGSGVFSGAATIAVRPS